MGTINNNKSLSLSSLIKLLHELSRLIIRWLQYPQCHCHNGGQTTYAAYKQGTACIMSCKYIYNSSHWSPIDKTREFNGKSGNISELRMMMMFTLLIVWSRSPGPSVRLGHTRTCCRRGRVPLRFLANSTHTGSAGISSTPLLLLCLWIPRDSTVALWETKVYLFFH